VRSFEQKSTYKGFSRHRDQWNKSVSGGGVRENQLNATEEKSPGSRRGWIGDRPAAQRGKGQGEKKIVKSMFPGVGGHQRKKPGEEGVAHRA